MKIDKTRFFLLTTTLAASTTAALVACTVNSTTNNSNVDASATQADGAVGSSTSSSGSSGSTTDAGDSGTNPGACLGDTGEKAFCAPDVEGVYDAGDQQPAVCQLQCEAHNDWFKPQVSRAMKDCLNLLPSAEGCTDEAAISCANKALDQACDDATAADWCTTNLACPGGGFADAGPYGGSTDWKATCVKIVRGMSAGGRTRLKDCFEVAGGVCAEGAIEDCFDGLKAGAAN